MTKFTAFCQDADAQGTIWINPVEASDIEAAKAAAIAGCAVDWGYDEDDIHCLGIAAGDVEILHWEDQAT